MNLNSETAGAKILQHILIDIDCLFDTRIATIAETFGDVVAKEVIDNRYYKRISDKFGDFSDKVDNDKFAEQYLKRDDITLSNSALTEFAMDLWNIVEGIIQARQNNPQGVGEIKLYINTYPYKLDEVEQLDIIACIQCYLPTMVPIELIHLPHREVTTGYLKYKDIAGYFTYDLDVWVNATMKGKSLDEIVMIPTVGIFPCMITAFDKKHMVQVIQENKNPSGEEPDPFETVTLGLASIIAVEWIPSHTYSLYGLAKANGEELDPTFR